MSKILTLDNLDVIKGYIDEQDQTTENACIRIIDEIFEEKISDINGSLEDTYNSVLNKVQDDLKTLDSKHTNYESVTDPRINNLESFKRIVNNVLDIKPTGNTHYSEKLKSLETKINAVSSGSNSNNNNTLSASELAKLLNDSAVIGQLSNSSNFGSGIIDLIQNSAKITPSNISTGTINNITIKPGKKGTWEWNSDGTGNIGGNTGIRVNQNGELTIGNSVKLNFYDNISNQSDIIDDIVNDCKEFITNDIIDDVIDKLGDTEGSVVHEILKPYNYALGYDRNNEEDNYTETITNSEGKLETVNRIRLNRIDNIEKVSDINQKIDNIPTVDLKESIEDMFETEYETTVKPVIVGEDTVNKEFKILKSNRLNKLDYALGYDRNNEEDNYTENITNSEGKLETVNRIRLNRIDNIEKRLDYNDQTLDVNQTIDNIPTVDLKESIGNMLETEYEDISKKIDGKDTDYKILKSKRLDDIENLLYINKTGKDGDLNVPYYNIITAIAGNPPGMINKEVSDKFKYVSEKGVLDMTFEGHEGGVWIPKSRVLDYIKDSIGSWDLGTNSENKNTITKNINTINSNIGVWNNENGTNTIKNAISANAINISNLDETISKNKKEFNDHVSQQIIDISNLNNKFNNIQTAFNTNNERLAEIIGAFASNVKTEELAALLVELLETDDGVTSTLNKLLEDYLKITVADDKYITNENFETIITLYEKKTDVDNKIKDALKDYTSTANLNLLLTNYITNTTLTSTLQSYAKNNDVYSQNAANDRFLNKNDFNDYLTDNGDFKTLQNEITTLNTDISNKADKSTVNNLQTTVDNKADKSTVNNLQATVDNKANSSVVSDLETAVSNLSQTVITYQATVNELNTLVTELQTRVTQLEQQLNNQ